jgi:hypothetical protein
MGRSIISIVLDLLDMAYDLLQQYVTEDYVDSLIMLRDTMQHIRDGMNEK